MQYPQIQFYRGSLVRLASGKLKQVEDLSSDDFMESARLTNSLASSSNSLADGTSTSNNHSGFGNNNNSSSNHLNPMTAAQRLILDENNNNISLFNSPEPTTRSSFNSPPAMKVEHNHQHHYQQQQQQQHQHQQQQHREVDMVTEDERVRSQQRQMLGQTSDRLHHEPDQEEEDDDDDDIELDVVTDGDFEPRVSGNCGATSAGASGTGSSCGSSNSIKTSISPMDSATITLTTTTNSNNTLGHSHEQGQDFYIDSSVVRDFLEVGPAECSTSTSSPASSTSSLTNQHQFNFSTNHLQQNYAHQRRHNSHLFSSTQPSTSTSSPNLFASLTGGGGDRSLPPTPTIPPPQPPPSGQRVTTTSKQPTVLIKFFLESSRTIAFIEVPTEHPFFVFHRGWSSWNPQSTYDKFGLKCRKLKIGDTCISLIRREKRSSSSSISSIGSSSVNQLKIHQQDSDHCNILFSSIKINE